MNLFGGNYEDKLKKGRIVNMIPKLIHYCWFGKSKKPDVFKQCSDSWRTYMPDYNILEWNEDNVNLDELPFLKKAFENKKWAFISDVIRLKVIYAYGGIYLDTDVEIYQNFDYLLEYDAFFFFQNHNQINTGLGFGAVHNSPIVKRMLGAYDSISFDLNRLNDLTAPVINTKAIKEMINGFIPNNRTQKLDNCIFVSFNEYCKIAHHFGEFSWKSDKQARQLKYSKKKLHAWGIRKRLRDSRIFDFFHKHRMIRTEKIYSFLVYDFIDYGFVYWMIKTWEKITKRSI